jgi:hypothetical protein
MPMAALDRAIDPRQIDDKDHLLAVAELLRVSPTALGFRLYNAKKISQSLKDSLCGEQSRPSGQSHPKRFSAMFVDLLFHGIDKGHVSARKAAGALDLTLPELADLFAEHSKHPAPFAY